MTQTPQPPPLPQNIMKFATLLTLLALAVSTSFAQDNKIPNHKGSKALQKIKSLAGTWTGVMDHGQGPQPVTIDYRVTAAGSAVVETFNPGTPMEMVTVYHDQKGKLVMTHYCMLGNQPRMRLVNQSKDSLKLDLVKNSGIRKEEAHMNALTVDFLDADRIRHTWAVVRVRTRRPTCRWNSRGRNNRHPVRIHSAAPLSKKERSQLATTLLHGLQPPDFDVTDAEVDRRGLQLNEGLARRVNAANETLGSPAKQRHCSCSIEFTI